MTDRYHRQNLLSEIGPKGQERIFQTSILIIGAGGLGSPALPYLAGAGFGKITIMDGDRIERSNLHRQILYEDAQQGQYKSELAALYCRSLNPEIQIEAIPENLNAQNAQDIIARHDIVLDGTDNFEAKFLINDVCVKYRIPMIYAAVQGWEGQCAIFAPHISGGCYRCFQPESPQNPVMNCAQSGVIGPVAGMIGCLQVCEAIKMTVNNEHLDSLVSRLHILDIRSIKSMNFEIPKLRECPVCSQCVDKIEIGEIKIAQKTAPNEEINSGDPILDKAYFIDVREKEEWDSGHIENAQHLPLSRLITAPQIFDDIAGHGPYVLYCQKGIRSLQALQLLKSYGYQDLYSLSGGYEKWPEK